MIVVRKLRKAYTKDSPFWWGKAGESGSIYIRYSHGRLQAFVCEKEGNPVNDGKIILNKRVGQWSEKDLDTELVKAAMAQLCCFED
jgi:hypothetical protein